MFNFLASSVNCALKSGWAKLISASALSELDNPFRLTAPYSVTTKWTSFLGVVTGPLNLETIFEYFWLDVLDVKR